MEAAMHALRAEVAALRAENAALRADAGAPPSASFRPAPDDSAVSLPPDLRTWESAGAGDALSGADLERYARHISLPAFGAAKQASLANARALVVGVGGLGSPACLYLAAAGVGALALADADVVERSNLHRQIAHADARRGASKALSAATAVAALNPGCHVTTHLQGITAENALALVRDADVVLDCTDNVQTRYLLSDACVSCDKPLVSAAAVGLEGQLSVYVRDRVTSLRIRKRRLPCYRCVFPKPPSVRDRGNCAQSGVLGPVPGVLGTLQALEAIKVLSDLGDENGGRLLTFDATADPKRAFRCVALRERDETCVACGEKSAGVPGAPRGEAIASYDYDAFVGQGAACERRSSDREANLNAFTKIARGAGRRRRRRRRATSRGTAATAAHRLRRTRNSRVFNHAAKAYERRHPWIRSTTGFLRASRRLLRWTPPRNRRFTRARKPTDV
jgi:adenylyltransferase/sulfurtransferase